MHALPPGQAAIVSETPSQSLSLRSQVSVPGQPPSVVQASPSVVMSSTALLQSLSMLSQASSLGLPASTHVTLLPTQAYLPWLHCPVPHSAGSLTFGSQHGCPTA